MHLILHATRDRMAGIDVPNVLGHVFPTVTGIASDTRAADVLAPVLVGVLSHLDHYARYLFGVERVCRESFTRNVTVITSFLR